MLTSKTGAVASLSSPLGAFSKAAVGSVIGVVMCAGGGVANGQTGPHRVVFTNIAGSSSAVPGVPGVDFIMGTPPAVITDGVFDRPFTSFNGKRWIFRGRAGAPATITDDSVIIAGGVGSAPTLVAREGSQVLGSPLSEVCGVYDPVQTINNAGGFGFACLTNPSSRIAYRSAPTGGASVIAARRGDPAPGTTGNYGNFFGATQLDDAGGLLFLNTGITTVPVKQGIYSIAAGATTPTLVFETGGGVNGTPTGQLVVPDQTWRSFTPSAIRRNRSGSVTLVVGTLNGPTSSDQVLAINNDVRIQENQPIPGSAAPDTVFEIRGAFINGAGSWIARGSSVTPSRDWVVLNGAVVARLGDPIIPGSIELWQRSGAETFFTGVIGCQGDWIIGGSTSSGRRVLVLNGVTVIASTGDVVDLNGDGLAGSAEPLISGFGSEELAILAGGQTLSSASLVDPLTGFGVGQGLLTIRAFCPGDYTRNGTVTVQDIFSFLAGWFSVADAADQNCDGSVSVQDIFDFLTAYFQGC